MLHESGRVSRRTYFDHAMYIYFLSEDAKKISRGLSSFFLMELSGFFYTLRK